MKKRMTFKLGVLFVCLIFSAGCRPVIRPSVEETSLKELCDRNNIFWQWDSVSQVVTLSRGGLAAKGLVGSSVVVIGDERVNLSGPLVRQRGVILVPPDFSRRVIERIVQRPSGSITRPYRIILDAGHGGKDPGASSRDGTQEKTVVQDITQRLKRRLEDSGYDVRLTRSGDLFLTLEERTEIASKFEADLFVSIHANSNPSRSVSGVEVYSLRDLTNQEIREPQRQRNHRLLLNGLTMERNNLELEKTVADMLFTYKRNDAPILASYLARGLSSNVHAVDRGAKQAGFFVLRNTLIPAVLIEVGFLSNPREAKLLKTGDYRQKVAEGIAAGIIRYLNR